jgi:hypothetical protein
MANTVLKQIENELRRIGAASIKTTLDRDFEPQAGELLKVELGPAYWHLQPQEFLQLLSEMPDKAGDEAVKTAIGKKATGVWPGPAPAGSRDATSI